MFSFPGKWRFPCLLFLGLQAIWAAAGVKQVLREAGHMRVVLLDSGQQALQSQNDCFRKGEVQVAVIAAGHIGSRKYYASIQQYLARHAFDAVLYEDCHCQATLRELEQACGADWRLVRRVEWARLRAGALELAYQWDEMDFTPGNFVFADLDATTPMETAAGIRKRAQNLRSVYQRSRAGAFAELSGADLDEAIVKDREAMFKKGGASRGSLAGEALMPASRDAGYEQREAHALNLLWSALERPGTRKAALCFGADHADAFCTALLAKGFRETGRGWLTLFTF